MRRSFARKEEEAYGPYAEEQGDQRALYEYVRNPEFKRLLNQIASAQEDMRFRSLVILSEYEGEGKTFFASALALAYAVMLRKNVLVVDAIRQTSNRSLHLECIFGPTVTKYGRGSENTPGIGSIDRLSTRLNAKQSMYQESSEFQIGSYIGELAGGYDLIIYDTCALTSAEPENMDPAIIAKYADVAVLVNSPRSLARDALHETKRELRRLHIYQKLLGIVYNSGVRP